jgi:NADH dehydrogenase
MILVVGATGSLGSKIMQGLVARDEAVRVLVRPERSARPGAPYFRNANVVTGDLRDKTSLARACQGVRAIVTTASASKTGTDSIENVDLDGNANLIAAAAGAGVEHLVFTSTLSASAQSPVPLFRIKALVEQRLRDSPLTHTILRPNAFMDVWFPMLIDEPLAVGNPVTLVGESRRRHSFVCENDVAAFAVAALFTPAASNSTIVIGGPEPVTWHDVVRAYESARGHPIQVRSVAPGDPLPGLPELVSGLAAALETFDSPVPMDEPSRTYGVRLTSIAEFARERVRGR